MIVATVIQNPIDPLGSRKIIHLAPGTTYLEAADILYPSCLAPRCVDLGLDIVFAVDGRIIAPMDVDIIPDGVSLVSCLVPHGGGNGGKILKSVAMLVVAIVAWYVSGPLGGGPATASFLGVTSATGIQAVTYGVGMGIALAGSMLVNAVLPMNIAQSSMENSLSQSSTYSWDLQGNKFQESISLPELYGEHVIKPPVIGAFIASNGDEQTLNLLYAVSKWSIDSVTDIKINNTAIADLGIPEPIIRYGTNIQEIVPAFDDTHRMEYVSTILPRPPGSLTPPPDTGPLYDESVPERWVTKTTQGSLVTKLGIGLSFPKGLCKYEGGGSVQTSVTLDVEYKLSTSGTWIRLGQTNVIPEAIAANRWSGGYYDTSSENGMPIWKELEEGSTTFADHAEGDPYTPDPSIWVIPGFPGADYAIPICTWHWAIDGETIIPESAFYTDYIKIQENKTGPFHRAWFTPGGLTPGTYAMRARFHDQPNDMGNSNGFMNEVWFEFYDEIIEEDFRYPNICVVGISAIATSKISGGMPTTTMKASRPYVWVYDPRPTFEYYYQASASNPAWICYDLLHKCRYLNDPNDGDVSKATVFGIPHTRIDYAAFKVWADWCDLVSGNKKAYTCNIYFDAPYNLRRALDMVGLCGRGSVIQIGSKFSCIVEKTEDTPVQRFLFTCANIEQDSFQEEFIPLSDRANMVGVTYRDETDDYVPKIVEVHSDDFDTTEDEIRKSSIDYIGCTDKDMAANFGKYLLNCNRYLTTTASWKSDIDAIACVPGDIVEVQHDVPQWGYGGRLLAGCTDTILLLDRDVPIASGLVYHVVVYHQADDVREEIAVSPVVIPAGSVWRGTWDGGETYLVGDAAYFVATTNYKIKTADPDTWTVCSSTGSTIVLVLASAMSIAPAVDSKYSFGEINQVAKLMRVIKITRDSEMKRKITAVEFVNAVFDDSTDINPQVFTGLNSVVRPPAFESVTLELARKIDDATKTWGSFIRISLNQDTAVDYRNLAIPISKSRVYAHIETGDTHLDPMSVGSYDIVFDWTLGSYDLPAAGLNGKTLYLTATTINLQGIESNKCAPAVLYVDTAFTPAPSTSNLSIDSYNYVNNGPNGYTVYFSWIPYGWALAGGKYAPVLAWNDGANYYVFDKYMIVYGVVPNTGDIPPIAEMMHFETSDIGNIFAADGAMITDSDTLDAICRGAASGCLKLNYTSSWVAIAVLPLMKNGTATALDFTLADFGLDWEWIHVQYPGGVNNNVTDNQIQNAELIYTMQPGSVFLNEMNWDYALESPYIDGFAIIARVQPYIWSWLLNGTVSAAETSIANIINAVDLTSGGGGSAASDFVDRYAEWHASGIPYFFMMFVNETAYEMIKIDTQTLSVTRGVEGTTARQWLSGATWSYTPCELIDNMAFITDTKQRNYIFNPPVSINMSLHCTIVAAKLIAESPGYLRSNYAFWDTVRAR